MPKKMCAFNDGKPVHQVTIIAKGKKVVVSRRLCLEHLEHQRQKMTDLRKTRKKLGICSRCKSKARKKADGTFSFLCQACRDYVRERERVLRAQA
jgi:hypothetical protein